MRKTKIFEINGEREIYNEFCDYGFTVLGLTFCSFDEQFEEKILL